MSFPAHLPSGSRVLKQSPSSLESLTLIWPQWPLSTAYVMVSFHSCPRWKQVGYCSLQTPSWVLSHMPLFSLSSLPRMPFTHLPNSDLNISPSFSKTPLGHHLLQGVFSKSLNSKEGCGLWTPSASHWWYHIDYDCLLRDLQASQGQGMSYHPLNWWHLVQSLAQSSNM